MHTDIQMEPATIAALHSTGVDNDHNVAAATTAVGSNLPCLLFMNCTFSSLTLLAGQEEGNLACINSWFDCDADVTGITSGGMVPNSSCHRCNFHHLLLQ